MKNLAFLFLVLTACSGSEAACCIDVVEAGDANEGGDHVAYSEGDFDGIEICLDNGAEKDCENKGGEAILKDDETNGEEVACSNAGLIVKGGSVYVQSAEDCPEGYVATDVE